MAVGADLSSAVRVKKTAEKTVGIDADTQHMMEDWAVEEREMMDRIEALSAELKQSQWQQPFHSAIDIWYLVAHMDQLGTDGPFLSIKGLGQKQGPHIHDLTAISPAV